jgi:uncharacterized membrane protein
LKKRKENYPEFEYLRALKDIRNTEHHRYKIKVDNDEFNKCKQTIEENIKLYPNPIDHNLYREKIKEIYDKIYLPEEVTEILLKMMKQNDIGKGLSSNLPPRKSFILPRDDIIGKMNDKNIVLFGFEWLCDIFQTNKKYIFSILVYFC